MPEYVVYFRAGRVRVEASSPDEAMALAAVERPAWGPPLGAEAIE